jgi:hypothetical protein
MNHIYPPKCKLISSTLTYLPMRNDRRTSSSRWTLQKQRQPKRNRGHWEPSALLMLTDTRYHKGAHAATNNKTKHHKTNPFLRNDENIINSIS